MARRFLLPLAMLLLLPSFLPAAYAQCYEFYTAAKVSDFIISTPNHSAGLGVGGSLTLSNSLKYGLPDTQLTLQLVRPSPTGFGSDVIDEFTVAENLNLRPNESRKVDFNFILPPGIPAGEYHVYTSAHSSAYDTGGDSSIEGTGIAAPFIFVSDETPDYLQFDRSSVRLSGVPYNSLNGENQTELEPNRRITLEFNLTNFGEEGAALVDYKLYIQDKAKHAQVERLVSEGLVPSDSAIVNTLSAANVVFDTMLFSMAKNETLNMSIPIRALPAGTYLLELKAIKNGTVQSFLQVRIPVRGGMGGIRFAAIEPFPIKNGQRSEIAVCHSGTVQSGSPGTGSASSHFRAALQVAFYTHASNFTVPIYNETKWLILTPDLSLSAFRFVSNETSGKVRLIISLLPDKANATPIDVSELVFDEKLDANSAVLKVDSAERSGTVRYAISLSDDKGAPILGRIAILVRDGAGFIVSSNQTAINGKLEGRIAAPAGGYLISVRELDYEITASSGNSTPYGIQPAGPNKTTADRDSPSGSEPSPQGLSIPLLILTIIALGALIAMFIFTLKRFGRGGRNRGGGFLSEGI